MEEIEWKLTNVKDPVLITEAVSHLMDIIVTAAGENEPTKELDYLKRKCYDEDVVLSSTACTALLVLSKNGYLNASETMKDFTTRLLSYNKRRANEEVIKLIGELLLIVYEKDTDLRYDLMLHQHPFVTILIHNPSCFGTIRKRVELMIENHREEELHEMLRSFYAYVYADPLNALTMDHRLSLWRFLIDKRHFPLHEILHWIQLFNDEERAKESVQLLTELIDCVQLKELSIVWIVSVLYEQFNKKWFCNDTLQALKLHLPLLESYWSINVSLHLITKCLSLSSIAYVNDLYKLCETLLRKNKTNRYVLFTLKSITLHWSLHRCLLTNETIGIESYTETNCYENEDPLFERYKSTNEHVYSASLTLKLYESFACSSQIGKFLKICLSITRSGSIVVKLFEVFLSLLLSDLNESDAIYCVDLITHCCQLKASLSTQSLTIFLYKLSSIEDDKSLVHLKLLKSLPKMAVLKENLPLIVNTFKALSESGDDLMELIVLDLYYELWKVQIRCYPLLQNVLLTNEDDSYLVKAKIVKDLCKEKPELYGSEMAVLISRLLNECKGIKGAGPSALALEALKHLCIGGVVDLGTAWDSLSEILLTDNRVLVVKSLCELGSEAVNLPDTSSDLTEKIVKKLWSYVVQSNEPKVIEHAFKALSCYNLEQISEQFPEQFEEDKKDAKFLPFGYIAGNSWLSLLNKIDVGALKFAGNLLVKLIADEISQYHGSVYDVEVERDEPKSYNYLQSYSLVRTLGNYCRFQLKEVKENPLIYEECLLVLSYQYAKPLPPFDWSFLQELFHENESLRRLSIAIGSRQVNVSSTARNFVENLFVALNDADLLKIEDVEVIYENLPRLCNSIQPHILGPFLSKSLNKLMDDVTTLESYCKWFEVALSDNGVLDVNKNVIIKLLYERLIAIGNVEDDVIVARILFRSLPCTSVRSWFKDKKELNDFDVLIYGKVSMTDTSESMASINEFLDLASKQVRVHDYVLKQFPTYLKLHKTNTNKFKWMTDYLNKIQVNLIGCLYEEEQLLFHCDVLVVATLIFSDYYAVNSNYLEERLQMFPQSLSALLRSESDTLTSQVLEWLWKMSNNEMLPLRYQQCYFKAMNALRHETAFKTNFKWMKYADVKSPF